MNADSLNSVLIRLRNGEPASVELDFLPGCQHAITGSMKVERGFRGVFQGLKEALPGVNERLQSQDPAAALRHTFQTLSQEVARAVPEEEQRVMRLNERAQGAVNHFETNLAPRIRELFARVHGPRANISTARSGFTAADLDAFADSHTGPQTDPEWECAICAEGGDEVVWLPCGNENQVTALGTPAPDRQLHGFHKHCITQWLQVSKVCPLCRTEVDVSHRKSTRKATAHSANPASSTVESEY